MAGGAAGIGGVLQSWGVYCRAMQGAVRKKIAKIHKNLHPAIEK